MRTIHRIQYTVCSFEIRVFHAGIRIDSEIMSFIAGTDGTLRGNMCITQQYRYNDMIAVSVVSRSVYFLLSIA